MRTLVPPFKMLRKIVSEMLLFLVFAVVYSLSVVGDRQATVTRNVHWYVNSNIESNVLFAEAHPGALSGFYLCCGQIGVNASGSALLLRDLTVDKLRADVQRLRLARRRGRSLGDNSNLTVHVVFSVAEEAIKSGAAVRAAEGLADIASQADLDGILCDYEPADNYTIEHATDYAWIDVTKRAFPPVQ